MAFKHQDDIEAVLSRLNTAGPSRFPGMSYEQGIEEALLWVRCEIGDDEFSYATPNQEGE